MGLTESPITGMEGAFRIGGDSVSAKFTTGRYGTGTVVIRQRARNLTSEGRAPESVP